MGVLESVLPVVSPPGDADRQVATGVFRSIADRTDESPDAVERRFHRRHRYVRYLVREGIDDADELFSVIADLATNEAATVERLRRRATEVGESEAEDGTD
jgi:hypothetical protein